MAVEPLPPTETTAVAPGTQITHPDGRVELRDFSTIADSRYFNEELAPVPIEKRTWNTYNFAAPLKLRLVSRTRMSCWRDMFEVRRA